ncbi:ACT domain-containing protein [Pantoea phytobeneficialis]|nr:ACT domain-containing protein [Pantoea phytobeneficialis]MDO6407038.1 ACT domain-containing protein [Pantoea phytobeneficialis]
MMSGENNLQVLLRTATPRRNEGQYVFCTLQQPAAELLAQAVVVVQEREGTTLVLPQAVAQARDIDYDYLAGWITLEVHSSLAAVGLTAAFSTVLAEEGISCNVVAGYYHDHIFVAWDDTERAIAVIRSLAAR